MTDATDLAAPRIDVWQSDDGVATVTIDNAAKLNALGSALLDEFAGALARLAAEPTLRVVVITGAGDRAFIGGADIREMALIETPDQARAFITKVHNACAAVRALPVPTIARIQGYCFGAGLELAAACDMRIAADGAQFGMPEVRLGIPSVVEAALLPTLIGWGKTRRLLFTGETIDAELALSIGLVEEVSSAEELDGCVEAVIGDVLACGPKAIRSQKALIAAWEKLPLADAIAAGIDAFAASYEADEPRAMMAYFLAARAQRKSEGD
jgi:enoyl-CoA hydratase/carnithine racemase